MQFLKIILLLFTVSILTSCSTELEIEGDLEQSKVIMDEERNLLTFYVRLQNISNKPSGNLFAKFELLNDELIEEFGEKTIVFVNKQQLPEAFEIQANSGYFIGESFDVEQTYTKETLSGAIEVVIFNEDGEDVTRFVITNVEFAPKAN